MTDTTILIRCITLLFRESQLENLGDGSGPLVKDVISTITGPSISVGLGDSEKDIIVGLKFICSNMATKGSEGSYVAIDILQKVRALTINDDSLFNTLKEGIEGELSQEQNSHFCLTIRQDLNQYMRDHSAREIIRKAFREIREPKDGVSVTDLIAQLYQEIEPYTTSHKAVDPAVVGVFNTKDIAASTEQFLEAQKLNDEEGILRFGYQGLNRMFGGGLRRGYQLVIGALQFNYKTGFTKQLFAQFPRYNKPYMIDPKKKPLIISISFEDPLALNMPFMFRVLWENIHNEPAPMTKDPREMAEFVNEQLGINGYDVIFMHVNPTLWTYRDIQNTVLYYESQGYEIHLLLLDYLAMVPTTGCKAGGPIGSDMRDMFRRMRNFTAPRKIATITPHQLSTEAKMLVRQGLEDTFVREIANKGYYDSCKTIDQEVDAELHIHIVKFNSRSWLTCQIGKHRLPKPVPDEFGYIVLPFEEIGNIREDVNGEDTTRKRVGGNPIGSKEAKPFWENEE